MPDNGRKQCRRALVVFGDTADLAWLKILRRGYRHCFAIIEGQPSVWVICDPLSHFTDLSLVAQIDGPAIARHYRASGYRVIETRACPPPKRPAPWRPYTCVEAVKRLLGLQTRRVFTPWQLHQFLTQEKLKENIPNYTLKES